ncbi:polyprenol phosphate mannosyl transferase 1 (Ppm1) [Actinoplanes italicus]|uniref:Glycosyltransferase involved in cell wall biosynthesis n=1 Tax=Actinoplanes italicus TaxID=113567 RepID=A0A2T0K9R2_9ACTN|nr:glycosyltransferase family 2 protein [Actinoplanes italicus]PRX19854.1 glycosyltransferase involved in cell wall biosynthesis [Actinoplanes italicus]GIE31706.1 polyprenol phosphate mannosyl transferase 1 (Ppm1) [Actinoplanes italicus]
MTPRVSVVIPVYNEGPEVVRHLERILREVLLPAEILVVHDMPEDTTVPYVTELARTDPRVRAVLNTYGRGPANAIRFGIDAARAPVAVVTMADGCDDPQQIDDLARLVDRGVVVAAASRYMPGGQQVGGPRFKRIASRWAGKTLKTFARVGTRDATNSFKAYDTDFVREVGIESNTGFEIGIELTAKATRLRRPVAEIPTIWLDRQLGESHFDVGRFMPSYLRWYFFAFGRRMSDEQMAARWAEKRPTPAPVSGRHREDTPA